MDDFYTKMANWLEQEVKKTDCGEIVIRVVRHDGQTRYVEKTVTRKTQFFWVGGYPHE